MRLFSSVRKFFRMVREKLSQYPVIYAIIGAVGVILFWRGVWHMADFVSFFIINNGHSPIDYFGFFDSLISMVIGFALLLGTGLFVSDFISSQMVFSAVKTEQKIEAREKSESERLAEMESRFEEVTSHLDEHLEKIEKRLNGEQDAH